MNHETLPAQGKSKACSTQLMWQQPRTSQEQALREANDMRMRLAETEVERQRAHEKWSGKGKVH
jgi:hypothetical protein